ncbi:hypothetical protein H70357_24915 [Paenibacillus sp. FSL H7-0357]|uniref:hypothetical protein n=1 Tax=Paenibacillus sp. FSL H7-0357 TaxID=1536774 RepID=UPI0004F588DA|nr:hypothetical protein [Paenibacillus sp. FSL H7-0357]AIQ19587.1 hypothetical protein H70357_24915 [Paenibacillus sp. FSL H7-0357]
METHYTRAVNRINNIDAKYYIDISNKRYEDVRSKGEYTADATLIAEYYRRVGVLLQFMSIEGVSIYAGMAKIINNEIELLDFDNLFKICPNLEPINLTVLKMICSNYIQWCILLDAGDPIAVKFHDTYEPIIKLFERGGGRISTHHHELVGGFGAFGRSIHASRGDMKEFDISDQALRQEIKEVEHAEEYVKEYKLDSSVTKNCLRCGNRLIVQENEGYGGKWYKIKCETNICFDQNFS